MQNFQYFAPTEVIFGKETELEAGKLVKKYGGNKALNHNIEEVEANMKTLGINLVQVRVGEGLPAEVGLRGLRGTCGD